MRGPETGEQVAQSPHERAGQSHRPRSEAIVQEAAPKRPDSDSQDHDCEGQADL